MGYTKLKKLVSQVEEEGIYKIYCVAKEYFKLAARKFASLQSSEVFKAEAKVMQVVSQLLLNILSFPFLMTVGEYYSDNLVENLSPIVLPESFPAEFFDIEFFTSLKNFMLLDPNSRQLPWVRRDDFSLFTDISLPSAKILSRCPAIKRNAHHDEQLYVASTAELFSAFTQLTSKALQAFRTGSILVKQGTQPSCWMKRRIWHHV